MSTMIEPRTQLSFGTHILAVPRGLRVADGATFDEWVEAGRRIGRLANASLWWVGDWLVHGHFTWGKRYEQAIQVTALDYGTLMNVKMVAEKVDFSRRRENLSFGHHQVVAPLDSEAQETWLLRAETEGLTREELREAVRLARGLPAQREPVTIEQVRLRLTIPAERADRWRSAAERAGAEFEAWVADVLDEAAA